MCLTIKGAGELPPQGVPESTSRVQEPGAGPGSVPQQPAGTGPLQGASGNIPAEEAAGPQGPQAGRGNPVLPPLTEAERGAGRPRSLSFSGRMPDISVIAGRPRSVSESSEAGRPQEAEGRGADDGKLDLVNDVAAEIDAKVATDAGRKRLAKAFRIIGAVLGLLAAGAGLAVGIMSGTLPLIVGAGILLAKSGFDLAGSIFGAKWSLEGLVATGLGKLGVSENTAAWIGCATGLAVSLAGIGCTLGGGIPGILAGKSPSSAVAIVSACQTAVSKTAGIIGAACAVSGRASGVDDPTQSLDDDEKRKIAGKLAAPLDDEAQLQHLHKLVLLAERYKAESGGRSLIDDLDALAAEQLEEAGDSTRARRAGRPAGTGAVQGGMYEPLPEDGPEPDVIRGRSPAPTQQEVRDIGAQAHRVGIASRVFKVLGGLAVTASGVFLAVAGFLTGGGFAGGGVAAAGIAAGVKGLVMAGEGIAGKSIGEAVAPSSPQLAAFVSVLPSIADALLGTASSAYLIDNPKSFDWNVVEKLRLDTVKVKLSDKSLASFVSADVAGKVGKVDPRVMARVLADASAVLRDLADEREAVNGLREAGLRP